MPKFTIPSVVELPVFGGVDGCLCYNSIKYGRIPIAVFTLLNLPHTSYSTYEDTILRIVLHFVCIRPFPLGVIFTGRGKGQSLR